MHVWVLGSGSSGNAAIFEAGSTRILVDTGVGPRTCVARMRAIGGELFPQSVTAIVITHHHNDHSAHLEPHARALRAPVYLHSGVHAPRVREKYEVRNYEPGAPFRVGGLHVEAIQVPHDAPQVALRISSDTHVFGLVTDLGHVPRELPHFLAGCDAALVEANHCPELLRMGPYPPRLRMRIEGGLGHLANEQTAELAAALVGTRLRRLYLGHISNSNNTPERALEAVKRRAGSIDVRIIRNGMPQFLSFEGDGKPAPVQLALF